MVRGFLNEIKNTAINKANTRINNIISDALGGGRVDAFGKGGPRVGLDRSQFAKTNPFRRSLEGPGNSGVGHGGHATNENSTVRHTYRAWCQDGGLSRF